MGRKCPPLVIRARKSRLEALAAGLALAYKTEFLGQTLPILTETSRDRSGRLCGYSPRYLRVLFDGGDELRGRVVPVAATRAEPETLFGHVAEKP